MVTHRKSCQVLAEAARCVHRAGATRWLARKPGRTAELPCESKRGNPGPAGLWPWSRWQKQNGVWEPESRGKGCERCGGSSVALVTTTSTHQKHKVTLEKMFKGCTPFSRRGGRRKGSRAENRMRRGTERSGHGRHIFSKEQEERETTGEGREGSRGGVEMGVS